MRLEAGDSAIASRRDCLPVSEVLTVIGYRFAILNNTRPLATLARIVCCEILTAISKISGVARFNVGSARQRPLRRILL
jgi:hypothetical protein